MQSPHRCHRLSVLVFAAVLLVHRGMFFAIHHASILQFLEQNSTWLTWQYLRLDAYRTCFWQSLLHLQQTPPVPHLVMGTAATVFGDDVRLACCCIGLQVLLTLLSGAAFLRLLESLTPIRILPLVLVCTWSLSPDQVVMEYCSNGQLLYECLTTFLLLCTTALVVRWQQKPSIRLALALGIIAGALALTRATFSYYAPLLLAVVAAGRPRFTLRQLAAFAAGVIALQGTWCLKNAVVFGRFDVATSSWKGLNLAAGLVRYGCARPFTDHIVAHADDHAPWFAEMVRDEGIPLWHDVPAWLRHVPQELVQQDLADHRLLGLTQRFENTRCTAALSDEYLRAYGHFACDEPGIVIRKTLSAYLMMWEPIHMYSGMYVACLRTTPVPRAFAHGQHPSLAEVVGRIASKYLDPKFAKVTLSNGVHPDVAPLPAAGASLPFLPGVLGLGNILVFHCCILLAPWWLLSRRPQAQRARATLTFLSATILYAALLTSAGEWGENMRFRMVIEPLLWLLDVVSLQLVVGVVRDKLRERRLRRQLAPPSREPAR